MSTLIFAVWLYWYQNPHWQLNPELKSWVLEQGSITKRCKSMCNKFKVRVLRQSWQSPMASEARVLCIPLGTMALVREVYLYCDNTPWIYGRSIIPVTTLEGKGRQLLPYLDDRPLGEFLFKNKEVKLGAIQVARLTPEHYEYQNALAFVTEKPPLLWGRRRVFNLYNKPLLVTEIFLPEFVGYDDNNS